MTRPAGDEGEGEVTGPSLGRLLTGALRHADQREREQLHRDWRAYLHERVKLSPQQQRNLRHIPPNEVAATQPALADAGTEAEVVVGLGTDPGRSTGELTVVRKGKRAHGRPSAGEATAQIKVTLLHCHFDANCRNCKCHLGPDRPDEANR